MKVLIVEDEQHLADGLRFNLEAEGYDVVVNSNGETALKTLDEDVFDAVILDVMLPDISGFDIARNMRESSDYTPILILTALGSAADVLEGFEAGADDYLPKPFNLDIFLARLNGLLRRKKWLAADTATAASDEVLTVNGRVIDLGRLELRVGDQITQLTLMEAKLLRYLIKKEGMPVSRKAILEDVWELQEDTDTRAIDNFIVRLRKLIEDEPNNPRILQTVRGVGYRFVNPDPNPT